MNRNSNQCALINALQMPDVTILEQNEKGTLLQIDDHVYMMDALSWETAAQWFEKHIAADPRMLLCLLNDQSAAKLMELYEDLDGKDCFTVIAPDDLDPGNLRNPDVSLRPALPCDLSWIEKHYALADHHELSERIQSGSLFVGLYKGQPAGFAGFHREGSMGMLYVLQPYRHQGLASFLEKELIKESRRRNLIGYAHIFCDNKASQALQKKLHCQLLEERIWWLHWKP